MAVDMVQINNALVFRDSNLPHRIYDAIGSGVVKQIEDFVTWPIDDTTGDPTRWKATITEDGAGDTTAVITDKAGGALLITTAANDNDGINLQLGGVAGESIQLDGQYPLYCGIRLAVSAVTQSDLLFGVTVTDTEATAAVTDGMYFRSADGLATLQFVTEKNSLESATTVHTLVDATYVTLEFYFDGTTVFAYVDDVLMTSQSADLSTFPDDEELRATLSFLTGAAAAITLTAEWMRVVHIR